ncbi:MAG TPA: ABC transporter ATP-binding protein [Thermoplasmata archaeon]|nr:ABC transporter ATP-binding protein [Thermoplasmata archaeon]
MAALPSAPTSPTSNGTALEVDGISKSFGATRALSAVSFAVRPGEIVGLLGPNGAGKSTAMKAVLGLLRPDTGRIRVLGRSIGDDPVGLKSQIGYVPESPSLYEFLTGAEYLDFVADMYGLPPERRAERIRPYLDGLELAGHEDALISSYSQGMRQKVALIAGLLHRPRLLILDEPLNGLDPRAARVVKDLVRERATHDRVGVLFSTHVLEIAQAICDRLVILDHGTVLASGTVDALRAQAGLAGSGLEDVFLALTGTGDLSDVVAALGR